MQQYPPNYSYRPSQGSESEFGSQYELKPWPAHYSSQASIASAHSYRSLLSTYTPSHASSFLPIVADAPNIVKKPPDNWGFAFCSLFINPIFGVVALLLAGMSKDYFNKCMYKESSKYGAYAKGTAAAGIASTCILLLLIIAQVLHYQLKFYYSY